MVELGTGRMTPELEAALVGAKAGETKSVSFPRGDGTTGSVDVTVKEVQEKILPPLDDELARAASEFDTLGELRESIAATLREQLDAEIDAAYRMAAVDELVRDSNVQPAASLVQSRAPDLLTGFVRSLERRGVSLETYLAASGAPAQDDPAPVRARGRGLDRARARARGARAEGGHRGLGRRGEDVPSRGGRGGGRGTTPSS